MKIVINKSEIKIRKRVPKPSKAIVPQKGKGSYKRQKYHDMKENCMKKFLVPIGWTVTAAVIIMAESKEDAIDQARQLNSFPPGEYLEDSFYVDECLVDELTEK